MPNSSVLVFFCFFLQGLLLCASRKPKPNIVIIFADDVRNDVAVVATAVVSFCFCTACIKSSVMGKC